MSAPKKKLEIAPKQLSSSPKPKAQKQPSFKNENSIEEQSPFAIEVQEQEEVKISLATKDSRENRSLFDEEDSDYNSKTS